MGKRKEDISIRSSAGEYLSYIASTGNGDVNMEVLYFEESIWMTQKMLATLYDTTKQNVSQHIQKIFDDNELVEGSTVKNFLTVQKEGLRQVERDFFAKVQNKMHYAVHGHTAAELIYERADSREPHMGLTTFSRGVPRFKRAER